MVGADEEAVVCVWLELVGDGPGVGPVAWLSRIERGVLEFLFPDGPWIGEVFEGEIEHREAVVVCGGGDVLVRRAGGGDIDESA